MANFYLPEYGISVDAGSKEEAASKLLENLSKVNIGALYTIAQSLGAQPKTGENGKYSTRDQTLKMIENAGGYSSIVPQIQDQQEYSNSTGQVIQNVNTSVNPNAPIQTTTPQQGTPGYDIWQAQGGIVGDADMASATPSSTSTGGTPTGGTSSGGTSGSTTGETGGTTGTPTAGTTGGTPTQGTTTAPDYSQQINQILSQYPGLSADQRTAITNIFNTVVAGDSQKAQQLAEGIITATQFSDPYFKAQSRLVLDSLSQGFAQNEGDLAYKEKSLQNSLDALLQDTTASKDYLDFNKRQQLDSLARQYKTQLSTTRDSLAATGFTSSSRRARSEELLSEQNEGLVQSTNKQFEYQSGNLDRQMGQANTQAQTDLARYQELAQQGRTSLLSQAEQKLGTEGLSQINPSFLNGYTPIGQIPGTINQEQARDTLGFIQNYVF